MILLVHLVFLLIIDFLLLIGHVEFEDVKWILKIVAHNLPFRARVVTHQMLIDEAIEKQRLKDANINPFTFEYAAKNNLLGCQDILGKYDYMWHNEHR